MPDDIVNFRFHYRQVKPVVLPRHWALAFFLPRHKIRRSQTNETPVQLLPDRQNYPQGCDARPAPFKRLDDVVLHFLFAARLGL